jgi:predicted acylesterase/phospholipase RssA/ABC-type phosphate/phosphonate transport system substrate-binding protein
MMHSMIKRSWLTGAFLSATCFASSPALAQECAPTPQIVKVGVSSYERVEETYSKYMKFLSELNMVSCGKPVAFQVAVGNYGEVIDWWQKGQIDVGIFSAAPVGELFQSDGDDKLQSAYVGSVDDGSYWDPEGNSKEALPDYHSMAVINDVGLGHGITTIKGAQTAAQRAHVPLRFVFVRPDSASGYFIPKYFLQSESIPLEHGQFSYGTPNSLEILRNDSNSSSVSIAFVYQSATKESTWKEYKAFTRLNEPPLESISIPVASVLVNYNLKRRAFETVRNLFRQLTKNGTPTSDPLRFFVDKTWAERFEQIRYAFVASSDKAPRIPLKEILNDLVAASHCEQDHDGGGWKCTVPRLALVLSGGGAKCAYQAGAISAILDTIDEEREHCSSKDDPTRCAALRTIDINVVAGTSGGSINALLVALDTTKTDGGRKNLQNLWESLDQNTLIVFPIAIRSAEAVLVASLLFLLLSVLVDRREPTCRRRVVSGYMLLSGLIVVGGFLWRAHPLALQQHMLEHGAMLLASASRDGGSVGIVGGIAFLASLMYRSHNGKTPFRRTTLQKALVVCSALAFLFFVGIILLVPALAKSEPIAETLAGGVQQELSTNDCSGKTGPGLLECFSREIFAKGLIKRDMIITASRLPSKEGTGTDDLYFTAHGHSEEQISPDLGDPRFVDFEISPNQGRLLSAIVGSSTIYPVFSAQSLSVKTALDSTDRPIDLVDGGFIHNSPIEAALKWKADRIILIEASPPDRLVPARTFLDNVGNAFSFLFSQAQRVDTSSRGRVEIYELRPECRTPDAYDLCTNPEDQWSMDLFDFTRPRLTEAVRKGILDVEGAVPRFLRLTGPPQFRDVGLAQ